MTSSDVLQIAMNVLNDVEMWDSIDPTETDGNRRIMILGYIDGVRAMTNEMLRAMAEEGSN